MQIKTTMRYHLTSVWMAIINKSTNNVFVRTWRKGNPRARLVGMQTGVDTWKTLWSFLKKIKNKTAF